MFHFQIVKKEEMMWIFIGSCVVEFSYTNWPLVDVNPTVPVPVRVRVRVRQSGYHSPLLRPVPNVRPKDDAAASNRCASCHLRVPTSRSVSSTETFPTTQFEFSQTLQFCIWTELPHDCAITASPCTLQRQGLAEWQLKAGTNLINNSFDQVPWKGN